jgi:hypothetical protein
MVGEGFIGTDSYVIIWPIEKLAEMNKAYEVSINAPGLLLFGSDGGGEALAFDMRSSSYEVVSVPFVGMDRNTIQFIAPTFAEMLKSMARITKK